VPSSNGRQTSCPVEQQAYLLARLRYVAGQQASKVRRPSRTSWGDRLGAQTLHDDGLAFVDHPMHMAVER